MIGILCLRVILSSVLKEVKFTTKQGFLLRYCYKSSSSFSKPNYSVKMPKPATHTVALKNHRQKLKEKGQKYSPGTVNLQVLGSGAKGAPRSLYMFTDQSR